MTYQSEYELEEQLILQLVNQGYEKIKIDTRLNLKNNFMFKVNLRQ